MALEDLDRKGFEPTIILLQTPSTKLQMIITDKLKARYHINRDSILTYDTREDLGRIKEVAQIYPPFADRWYLEIDVKRGISKELAETLKQSSTIITVLKVDRYGIFKTIRDTFAKQDNFLPMYIQRLQRKDFGYLYSRFNCIVGSSKLTADQLNFTYQSYGDDIDSIITLFESMSNGVQFNGRSGIMAICGVASNSVENYVLSFFKELSGSEKGLKTVIKNKIVAGRELIMATSPRKLYYNMLNTVQAMMLIKELRISGKINHHVENLPIGYNETQLARYQKYITRLDDIPMSSVVRLHTILGKKEFSSELDFLGFIYRYYDVMAQKKYAEMEANVV